MKKIFTLICVMLGLTISATAQTLTFSHEGNTIASGSTFTSGNIYEDPLGDLFGIPDEVRPEIFLSCSTNETVVCVVEDVDQIGGIKFCFGGNCQSSGTGGIYTIEKEYAFQGEALDIQLDFVLPMSGYSTGKAKVTAWVKGKKETTMVSINVVMSNDPEILSTIGQVQTKDVAKVIGKSFYYEFNTVANRTFTVYGLNGAQVMNVNIADAAGSVSLASLPKGVYIYRLMDATKTVQRKFILK